MEDERLPPPTIDHLRGQGLLALNVYCLGTHCHREARIAFDDLPMPGSTAFPAVRGMFRFRCTKCGSRAVEVRPDWTDLNAPGMGRPVRG